MTRKIFVMTLLTAALSACSGDAPPSSDAIAAEGAEVTEAVESEAAGSTEAAAAPSTPHEKFIGSWHLKLDETARAELELAKKALAEKPDDPMLRMGVAMAEMQLSVAKDTMTMSVMGEGETVGYSAVEQDGKLLITAIEGEGDTQKEKTFTIVFTGDRDFSMEKEGQDPIKWERAD